MKALFRSLAVLLALTLCLSGPALAASAEDALAGSAAYILRAAAEPAVGSVGGEWAVLGLARSGCDVPQTWWDRYYAVLAEEVAGREGSFNRNTDYARMVLALTAMGRNPRNVAGYDLLAPLGNYDSALRQGVNGAIWALIALDCGGYDVPAAAAGTQATRELYREAILSRQLEDGGWSPGSRAPADPDETAMALQALSPYRQDPAVAAAIEDGLACLSAIQNADGSFGSSSESCAQAVVALCTLGIPLDDPRFVKNGASALDALLTYRLADGSFQHTMGDGANQMASEQGLYALAAVHRAAEGLSGLYDMTDPAAAPGTAPEQTVTAGEMTGLFCVFLVRSGLL
ncbi:MAG: terpene cyclase/mutase family protein [Oscillospiraceae bacterium]|nr:terpene cyclase/mutase family protein [Oscillospiraceae bacterium]